ANVTQPGVRVTLDGSGGVTVESRPRTAGGLKSAARVGLIELTEAEEQFIRDDAGYAVSETRTLAERDEAARRMVAANPLPAPGSTVTRVDEHGQEVEEPVGPAGLSLVAFPVQTPGDLTPTPEQLAKLGLLLTA